MKLIKKIFILIFGVIIIAIGTFWAYGKGYLDKTPLKSIDKTEVEKITQDASDQTKVLTERAKETGSHVQQVLGEAIQKNEDEPIANKTIEYAQYLYCKQVVAEYEK
jgi:hypothetical protein